MVTRTRGFLAFSLVAATVASVAACGGSDDDKLFKSDEQPGHEGQPCFENMTCIEPLKCVSGVCVDLSQVQGGAAGSGTAGSGIAGSTAGTTLAGSGGSDAGAAGTGGSDAGAAGTAGSDAGAAGTGGSDAGAAGTGGSAGQCVGADYPATQPPASFLLVLDRSASMNKSERWQKLVMGAVKALDEDPYDRMHVGVMVAPSTTSTPPLACATVPMIPGASCGVGAVDVPIDDTTDQKSSAFTGVRSKVKALLASMSPAPIDTRDTMPLHASVDAALTAMGAAPAGEKRTVIVLSDGSPSCGGDSGREGYPDCTGCAMGWESPNNVVSLVAAARASFGIQTAVVGLPGSEITDPNGCEAPAFTMRLGFSAIAYAGSDLVPPGCNGTTFLPGGGVPTVPCHRDLTQDGGATPIAEAIVKVRTRLLGCSFALPDAGGGTIDLSKVNMKLRLGASSTIVPRRSSPGDACTDAGCWDLDDDQHGSLIGKACDDYLASGSPAVSFSLGCPTAFK